jgi:hypothetical protein
MPVLVRRLALAAVALGAFVLSPAVAPAGAVVTEAGGPKVGLQPRSTLLLPGETAKAGVPLYPKDPAYPEKFANSSGAPVLASSRVYAIYWDPTDNYHGEWQNSIDAFMQAMGSGSGSLGSVFAVDSQYTDAANQHASYRSTFMGAVTDTEKYPVATCVDPHTLEGTNFPIHEPNQIACLTDKQIRAQLESFIAQHSLPKGMGTIFYVLTPPGVTVCLNEAGGLTGHCSDYHKASLEVGETKAEEEAKLKEEKESYENSFCSYHADVNLDKAASGDASTILYAVIPWTAGGVGDGGLGLLGEESMAPGYPCQDGGINPISKPQIEQPEKPKKLTEKEQEEFNSAKPEEKEQKEKERELEGPHVEEPNQLLNEVGPDGAHDFGLSDVIINQIAVEQQNTVTDPLLDGWQDSVGNEATDECRNFFASGDVSGSASANEFTDAGTLSNQKVGSKSYYLNNAFDLAALKLPYPGVPCLGGDNLVPQFTAPNPVNSEEIVGFDGMESDIALDAGTAYNAKGEAKPTYATYTWNFGDGTPTVTGYAPGQAPGNPPSSLCEAPWLAPCAGSTFHSYKYGGEYEVTLTVTDVGGNTASTVQKITVVGPPAPGTSGSGSGPGGSGTGVSSGVFTPIGSGGPGGSTLPRPVATAAATSNSLKQVARNGLVVHYTVNEQVAGRFEVLLEAAAAHHLGIGGPVATNLPSGSPKSLVIGHALLVTTKGGKSSVRIKFSPSVAKHLRHAHKVKLTLRLTARNASAQNPLFTTVMSTVVLHG